MGGKRLRALGEMGIRVMAAPQQVPDYTIPRVLPSIARARCTSQTISTPPCARLPLPLRWVTVPRDVFGGYTVIVSKTFYIETFGCQMNAHDSEKVIGTLEQQGYARVEDEGEAGLILYNTCSIRDKAEQKVFHRLNEYKRLQGEGKKFAVLGCVAQQEGEKIFEKAPYVSLVAGSASYRNLPEM